MWMVARMHIAQAFDRFFEQQQRFGCVPILAQGQPQIVECAQPTTRVIILVTTLTGVGLLQQRQRLGEAVHAR